MFLPCESRSSPNRHSWSGLLVGLPDAIASNESCVEAAEWPARISHTNQRARGNLNGTKVGAAESSRPR